MIPNPGDHFVVVGTVVRQAREGDVVLLDDGTGTCLLHCENKFWAKFPGQAKLILCVHDPQMPKTIAAFDAMPVLRDKFPGMFDEP